jgi:hypothetical protein
MDVGPRKLCVGSTAKIRPWKSEKGAARAHFALGGPLSCTDRPPLRVANDVDKQDMGDLELDLFFNFGGHRRNYFGASEATSLSKRGSPRSGSQ